DEKFKSLYQKKKGRNTRIFNTAFDYGSIMMPEISFGSKNGRNAYEVLKSKAYIHMVGQREEFSHNDLKKINDVYCKGLCARKFKGCKHGGYFSSDYCVCNCPPGYAGKTCTKIAKSVGYCGRKKRLFATESKRRLVLKGKKKCVIAIDTRAGRNVALVVEKVETERLLPCVQNKGLEIKYRYDKGATGLVLCGSYRNISIPPTFSRTLLIYHGLENNHEVRISYREVKRRK
uniref:Astacin domain-containing protein n=1 Tax=Strongyloides papillosus TaxID=174720 RepID=A0A0N5BTP7_STREA